MISLKLKLSLGIALGAMALPGLVTTAKADGIPGCSVRGVIEGSALLDHATDTSNPYDPPPKKGSATLDSFGGYGDAAIAYACNGWAAQIDGAYGGFANQTITGQKVGTVNVPISSMRGHMGGALYFSDSEAGRIGLAGSRIFADDSLTTVNGAKLSYSRDMWRLGAFGEYYAGRDFTLGAGAFYLTGNDVAHFFGDDTTAFTGADADAYVKYYANDNLSFLLRGDFGSVNYPFGAPSIYDRTLAATMQAEYKIADEPISLFAGGTYGNQEISEPGQTPFGRFENLRGFVGVRFDFGGNADETLKQRDRSGPIDNTSVTQEKLVGVDSIWLLNN